MLKVLISQPQKSAFLAAQSKNSAEKINNLVADINNALDSTVTVTNECTKTVEEGKKNSQKTAGASGF